MIKQTLVMFIFFIKIYKLENMQKLYNENYIKMFCFNSLAKYNTLVYICINTPHWISTTNNFLLKLYINK